MQLNLSKPGFGIAKVGPGSWGCPTWLAVAIAFATPAIGGPFQLVSTLDPAQTPPASGGGDSCAPIISPDGRYVLFASTADNLVVMSNSNPIPAVWPPPLNVFLRDRTNGTTTLVSVNLSGVAGGNGNSLPAGVSTNGRYAVFESSASDLVPGDTNNASDVFVRDLVAGTTLLASVSADGGVGNGASYSPDMTPDGRYVAFVSAATNLVTGDTNGIPDVFVRDFQAGTTVLASIGAMPTNQTLPNASSESPVITPNGRYVAFYSTATNLVPGVASVGDVYIHDLLGGTTRWASSFARAALQSLNRSTNAVCYNYAISDHGHFLAYEANSLPTTTSAIPGVILRYNVATGLTDIVHTNAAVVGFTSYENLCSLDMTPDGRFIAFVANTNGTSGDTTCICVWDGQTGTTTLASGGLSNAVPLYSGCEWPALDANGRFVAFLSTATNLVTNAIVGDYHLYVRDMQSATTLLLDADTNGVGSGLSLMTGPAVSADGRFVAFQALDGNLVPGDRNHGYDVFVRDLEATAPELISVRAATLASVSPNGSSTLSTLSVSTDGRYIAFASDADNLVANDTNGCWDVFVRDLLNGTNLLVTAASDGFGIGNGPSTDAAISGDGRYVAFSSRASNLVAGDSNNAQDVFVRNLESGMTSLVSVNSAGSGPGNNDSYSPMISSSGRYILFRSKASNLAPGSFSGTDNLFLRDAQTGTNYALTTTGAGTAAMTADVRYVAFGSATGNLYVWDSQAATKIYTLNYGTGLSVLAVSSDGNRIAYVLKRQLYQVDRPATVGSLIGPAISGTHARLCFSDDGRFLTYAGPLNGTNQVFLYDFQDGTSLLVSSNYTSGSGANGASDSPDITPDGSFVAYRSAATDLVPGDTNDVPDMFLYDRLNGTTTLLSASRFSNSTADNRSLTPVFSGDGQTLAFQSWASDLIAEDFNQWADILAYNVYSSGQIPVFSLVITPGVGQAPRITWPIVSGRSYRVQFKNSLSDPDWQEFSGGVTNLGNQAYFNDFSAGDGPRFYRVVAY